MISQIQFIAYAVIIAGLGTGYYFYHVKPMKDFEIRIETLEEIVNAKNITINNLDIKLRACKEKSKRDGFIEFLEGLSSEVNTTDYPKFTF